MELQDTLPTIHSMAQHAASLLFRQQFLLTFGAHTCGHWITASSLFETFFIPSFVKEKKPYGILIFLIWAIASFHTPLDLFPLLFLLPLSFLFLMLPNVRMTLWSRSMTSIASLLIMPFHACTMHYKFCFLSCCTKLKCLGKADCSSHRSVCIFLF